MDWQTAMKAAEVRAAHLPEAARVLRHARADICKAVLDIHRDEDPDTPDSIDELTAEDRADVLADVEKIIGSALVMIMEGREPKGDGKDLRLLIGAA